MTIADKLAYLGDTKQLLRQALEGVGQYIPNDSTTFREYVTKLADSQRTLGLNFAGESYDLLNPINDVAFADELTFTRGSTGTYWDRQGLLQTASVDEERITHNPSSLNSSVDTFDLDTLVKNDIITVNLASTNTYSLGDVIGVSDDTTIANHFYALIVEVVGDVLTCQVTSVGGTGSISAWTIIKSEGLLIEEQRTNLLLWSEDFTQGVWSKGSGAEILSTAENAPDGSSTATKFSFTGGGAGRLNAVLSLPASATFVLSVFAKSVTQDSPNLRVLGSVSGVIATKVYSPPGEVFERFDLVFETTADVQDYTIYLNASNDSQVTLWGAQLEAGSFPTSYIKTEGSQVTRSVDNCSRDLGFEFNASEGTVFARSIYKGSSVTTIFDLGGTDLRMQVRHDQDSKIRFVVIDSVGSLMNSTPFAKTYTPGAPVKVAISYKSSELIVSVDGETSAVEVFRTPWGAMELAVGSRNSTAPSTETGVISVVEARFIPRALSATELEALTS